MVLCTCVMSIACPEPITHSEGREVAAAAHDKESIQSRHVCVSDGYSEGRALDLNPVSLLSHSCASQTCSCRCLELCHAVLFLFLIWLLLFCFVCYVPSCAVLFSTALVVSPIFSLSCALLLCSLLMVWCVSSVVWCASCYVMLCSVLCCCRAVCFAIRTRGLRG